MMWQTGETPPGNFKIDLIAFYLPGSMMNDDNNAPMYAHNKHLFQLLCCYCNRLTEIILNEVLNDVDQELDSLFTDIASKVVGKI